MSNEEKVVWYIDSEGGLYCICPRSRFTRRALPCTIQLSVYSQGFLYGHDQVAYFDVLWDDRENLEFQETLSRHTNGGTLLESLDDMPVILYRGFSRENAEKDKEKVFIVHDQTLQEDWRLAKTSGICVPASSIEPGTRLSAEAKRLFARLFGNLSVDNGSDTFLGQWRQAAEMHVRKIRKQVVQGYTYNQAWNALNIYVVSHQISDMMSLSRLAFIYFNENLDMATDWIYRNQPRVIYDDNNERKVIIQGFISDT